MNHQNIVLVVSVTIYKNSKVFIIQETKPKAFKKWNFPSGRIEIGEDILKAARREVKEETGYDVELISTSGIYNFKSQTNDHVILFHFTAEIIGGAFILRENEISDSKWIRLEDLLKFKDNDLREKEVNSQIINNLLNKNLHDIDLFNKKLF
ncbi:NUDIX hydrolase [Metabacillus litoralis]|uniref:NUDIX hydrolase n=1 Tax=Metabacillus litoralis TaxID=152268 RepID=A0A5C6VML9_9BACI|nr:NUDIX hydrolase [Metabacillus litoralis]TXC86051.1 NUDIX hydrolase [Metabacillus litoralis]